MTGSRRCQGNEGGKGLGSFTSFTSCSLLYLRHLQRFMIIPRRLEDGCGSRLPWFFLTAHRRRGLIRGRKNIFRTQVIRRLPRDNPFAQSGYRVQLFRGRFFTGNALPADSRFRGDYRSDCVAPGRQSPSERTRAPRGWRCCWQAPRATLRTASFMARSRISCKYGCVSCRGASSIRGRRSMLPTAR